MTISRRNALKALGLTGVGSLTGLAGCTSGVGGSSTTIGVIMPVSGTISELGPGCRDAADVAVQEINDAGGVLDDEFEVQHEDSESIPDAGVRAANRLIEEVGVPAMVGPLSSGVGMSIAPIAADSEVTYFPGGSSPAFTSLDQTEWVFRTRPSDAFVGAALAKAAYESRGVQTASSIVVNNDFGIGLADAFEESFTELGGEVIARERANVGQTSFRSELETLFNEEPDAVLNGCYQDEATNQFRQWFEQDLGGQWMIHSGLLGAEFLNGIGENIADGIFAANPKIPDSESNSYFRKLMEDTDTGDPGQTIFPMNTYDAVNMIALAIEKAGEATGEAIRSNLRDIANPPGTDVSTVGDGLERIRNDEDVRYVGASHTADLTDKGEAAGLTFSEIEIEGTEPVPVDEIQLD